MNSKNNKMSIIFNLAVNHFEFIKTNENLIFVRFKDKPQEFFPLRSKICENALRNLFYAHTSDFASTQLIKESIENLEAIQSPNITEQLPMYTRIAHVNGEIYIDLNNPKAPFVKIDKNGWIITDASPVIFNKSPVMHPLPIPKDGGSIEELNEILQMEFDDFYLIVAFILGVFMPPSSYPILFLQGSDGTGKSTLTQLIKKVVDPSLLDALSISSREDDLFISANSHLLLAFDNVSSLPREKSDWLCKVTTGSSLSRRTLFKDFELTSKKLTKPILINSIEYIGYEDFLSRTLFLRLKKRTSSSIMPLQSLYINLTEKHPKIFGAILNLISLALQSQPTGTFNYVTRLVDFEKWIYSIEPGLKIPLGSLNRILKNNAELKSQYALDTNLFLRLIVNLVKKNNSIEVTPTMLYNLLIAQIRKEYGNHAKNFIPAPNKIKNYLYRSESLLFSMGIKVSYHRTSTERTISLTSTSDSSDSSDS